MGVTENPWDTHATAYAAWVARREQGMAQRGMEGILPILLDLLGDVTGKAVLDAGCGEGFLARILAARGGRVTGIDLSPRLIAVARERDPQETIAYRVADLSQPVPDLAGRFDRIGSHLVLNDVADHRGFATTLAALSRPGGRAVIAFNNPYSAVVREHIADYFASGARAVYSGMTAKLGGEVDYYHRTLEDYLDAFLTAGWRLAKLADVPAAPRDDLLLPLGSRFPILALPRFCCAGVRPEEARPLAGCARLLGCLSTVPDRRWALQGGGVAHRMARGGDHHAARCSTRRRSRSTFARPYIWRFTSLSRVTCPSVWPLLHSDASAASTAARSCRRLRAQAASSSRPRASARVSHGASAARSRSRSSGPNSRAKSAARCSAAVPDKSRSR